MHSQHGHRASTLSVGSPGVVRTEDAHGSFAGRGCADELGVEVMAVSRWKRVGAGRPGNPAVPALRDQTHRLSGDHHACPHLPRRCTYTISG